MSTRYIILRATIIALSRETEDAALASIEHDTIRGSATVQRVRLHDILALINITQ